MAKLGSIKFKGASGTAYDFNIYPIGSEFKAIGGVYVISRREKNKDDAYIHNIIYVGHTKELDERFDDHHKAQCFVDNNANCISIHTDDSKESRLNKESDLIERYDPPCNG